MELIEFNPRFGRATYVEDDPLTGDSIIREVFQESHAKAVVDRCRLMNNHGLGRGDDMRLHCSVPPVVQEELRQIHGIDCRNSEHWPALFQKIRTDYPYLIVNS